MKLQFQSDLAYQKEAIESIVNIFEGQEVCRANFSVVKNVKTHTNTQIEAFQESYLEMGYGNKLALLSDEILANVRKIQLKNGLEESKKLEKPYNFSVEMETGTGKTYVFLRTILELNQKYGLTKFIIVVPSIAIKEGIKKSIEITQSHFKGLYDNVIYNHFIYTSKNLEQVRNFATSSAVEIMIMTIDAFNKDTNIINLEQDRMSGFKPIDFIAETHPVIIIDEPQTTVSTDKQKEAISNLNPLFIVRYSATHKEKINLMYRLDAVDAYDKKLVKQIEVASITLSENHNLPYLKLLSVASKNGKISAKIELDVKRRSGVKRTEKTVQQGDSIEDIAQRSLYDGYQVVEINCTPGGEFVDFLSHKLKIGQVLGMQDPDVIKRLQIETTIREHLKKENKFLAQGIKVLSLFFIDRVKNYRDYTEDGVEIQGKYTKMFEEGYKRIIQEPEFQTLVENRYKNMEVSKIHNGYFSQDTKKRAKDTNGSTKDDDDTYELIMKDKERLLSLSEPLRFIFSHSALREGWDNPNVFQICTLNESSSEVKKRQEIGRGLRLAVYENGERSEGFQINYLTVMANESYEEFVSKLQKEFEEENGIKFGVLENHIFSTVYMPRGDGGAYLGAEKSKELVEFLTSVGYVDSSGKVSDKLKEDLVTGTVTLPQEYHEVKESIIHKLKMVAGNLNIKKAEDKREIKLNKEVYLSPEFMALWDKIKYKTYYEVNFDSEKLIQACITKLKEDIYISQSRYSIDKSRVDINRGGVVASDVKSDSGKIHFDTRLPLPDILTYIQNETNLTRKSISKILTDSGTLNSFKKDPQKYIEQAVSFIKEVMKSFVIDGIKYHKIGDTQVYEQTLFESSELIGHLKSSMVESFKSPFTYTLYDSEVEKQFAQDLERNTNIKLYAKLPANFKIETPLGNYNPDWAIVYEERGEEKLYFIAETKGTLLSSELREVEKGKIHCGKKHFEALSNDIHFEQVDSLKSLVDRV